MPISSSPATQLPQLLSPLQRETNGAPALDRTRLHCLWGVPETSVRKTLDYGEALDEYCQFQIDSTDHLAYCAGCWWGSGVSALKGYGLLDHVKAAGPSNISFVHNHRLLRASKIYLNIYHLWPKWVNGVLACCGLSGGFHSAIEIFGREYQFRGCSNVNEGIFETHPAHCLNQKVDDLGKSSLTAAEKEIYSQVGRIKKRRVLGLWSGSKTDFELLLCHMKEGGGWRGPKYKMLSFNCNHFVLEACEYLLSHTSFHPTKGRSTKEGMVPKSLFRLTGAIQKCCSTAVTKGLDEDIIPPANGQIFAFRGKPYMVGVAPDKHRSNAGQRVTGSSMASGGIGASRLPPSIISSSALSSNTTIDIGPSTGPKGGQRPARSMPLKSMHRGECHMQKTSHKACAPSRLRQLELFRKDIDKDRQVASTSGSSFCNTTGTDSVSDSFCRPLKHPGMREITEEVSPPGNRGSYRSAAKIPPSRSPSRVTPRTEPAFEGPTRLVGYKSIDDVPWLEDAQQGTIPDGDNGNSTDRQYSSKSTSSSARSKPPALGIGVELRAKSSRDFEDDGSFETRQPSPMERDLDCFLVGIQMTRRFSSQMASSSGTLTAPMTENGTSRTISRFGSSPGGNSSLQVPVGRTSSMPQVIGNPTFLNSGELTPDDFVDSSYTQHRQGGP